jgi:hypothetical protein
MKGNNKQQAPFLVHSQSTKDIIKDGVREVAIPPILQSNHIRYSLKGSSQGKRNEALTSRKVAITASRPNPALIHFMQSNLNSSN